MNINSISQIGGSTYTSTPKASSKNMFQDILDNAIKNANETDLANKSEIGKMLSGNTDDLHTSMIAMEKAEIALQYTIQVRNKILDAYNEIMRMQI
ncbi:MAG: flagellar hook-basal body complex protein FliE [Eubacteriales bacterium]|jgi:flagellar hook-basal body complex protein FliE|nr:flagellar hook-basal body complex protein FliE [Eubacteriales bacterium]